MFSPTRTLVSRKGSGGACCNMGSSLGLHGPSWGAYGLNVNCIGFSGGTAGDLEAFNNGSQNSLSTTTRWLLPPNLAMDSFTRAYWYKWRSW